MDLPADFPTNQLEFEAVFATEEACVTYARKASKFPNPSVHVSTISLKGYAGDLRQVIVRGNGHEKPAFLITNDFDTELPLLVGNYARRWRVENGIAVHLPQPPARKSVPRERHN